MKEPLPAWLWEQLKAFLADERTGTISLNVNRGAIESADIRERLTKPKEKAIS